MAADRARARAVAAALARGALGDRYHPQVPDRMFEKVDSSPSEGDRKRFLGTMSALDTRAGALALTGSATPVSWLAPDEAEALLIRWKTSRIEQLRHLGRTLISLATSSAYAIPGHLWPRLGYQGPLGPAPDEPRRLSPIEVGADEVFACDVAIVGSGAGGGAAAAVLAQAGLDVIVVEKGLYRAERDFHHLEAESMRDMYLYGGILTTDDLGVHILAGSVLGGGTLVNYATAFRPTDETLRNWADVSGIDAFANGEILEHYAAAEKRLNVNRDSAPGARDRLMEEGLKALGWHVDALPRAVQGCTADTQCGWCGFGCRVAGKRSTMRTYLEDADAAGARMITGLDVREVVVEDGRARGLKAQTREGHKVRVHARAVVVACGAIETPALLLRSGLRGQVGHNLRLHPGTASWGHFDEEVRVWEGTLQSRYSAEFSHWDGGWGPIFETVPIHPSSAAAAFPWLSRRQHAEFMDTARNISFCAVLPRDASAGRVRIDRKGAPRISYKLGEGDRRRIVEGIVNAGRVVEAAGARRVSSPHPVPISYAPGKAGAHEAWADEVRSAGLKDVTYYSYHQMGSCRMGVDPRTSAVDADNESHEVKGLYVLDGSTFPTASGVNPMLSIYAIALRGARKLAERLS